MAEQAARWVDDLIPKVAVRQWVLTVPWRRRWDLARHHAWARGVLRILVRRVQAFYRRRLGLPAGRTGSVTVVQRFGGGLNLNVHFHVLMLDGLYVEDQGRMVFRRAPRLSTRHVEQLVVDVATRAERWLLARVEDGIDHDEAMPQMQGASVQGRSAVTGKRARRVQRLAGREFELPPRCASFEGYNLHGNTCVPAKDRTALEKLCRYVLRPALAKDRVRVLPDGRVKYELKRAWANGVTDLVFTAEEFVERLAALVPPPRVNTVLYHGLLAARAKGRGRLLPRPKPMRQRARVRLTRVQVNKDTRWTPWEELLRRVFGVDGLRCPHCGQQMTLRTVVVRPPATAKVLEGLARAARGPP